MLAFDLLRFSGNGQLDKPLKTIPFNRHTRHRTVVDMYLGRQDHAEDSTVPTAVDAIGLVLMKQDEFRSNFFDGITTPVIN
jgi:hypothetical protein